MPDLGLFTVGSVPGKGLGVTAKVPLGRGQQLMREQPLIDSPANLVLSSPSLEAANQYFSHKVELLPAIQQQTFYSLSDWRSEQAGTKKSAYHVFRSNALPKGHGKEASGAAVYETICRINHNCLPNCHYSWNSSLGCQFVHTTCSIQAGEELGVTYIELFASHKDRRKRLLEKFGFICTCPACAAEGNTLLESDERRLRLAALDHQIRDYTSSSPQQLEEGVREFQELFEEEGIANPYLTGRTYLMMHKICEQDPRYGDAQEFAELALRDFVVCEGKESVKAKALQRWLQASQNKEAATHAGQM